MDKCKNCGKATSNILVAECGYTFACKDCVDYMWEKEGYIDSDGRSRNFYYAYRIND